MSKKTFKSQASSNRAASGAFGGASSLGNSFGSSPFGAVSSTPLSYVYEPPDLSGLSDPQIGVALKNVQKKDSTTKAKALEELSVYASSRDPGANAVEDDILEAWIKVYPRTSIDSSRRVRQLAHSLQGQIALSCGKRMGKHMPAVVGPWVAGLYDNDKSVSRATNASFENVFSSEEKRQNLWRVYQCSVLQFSSDVITKETAATLSDERITSPDDASAKYSRVVCAAVAIVTSLLENLNENDLEKSRAPLGAFLNEDKVWKLAEHEDTSVRRAVYRLLVLALAKQKNSLNPSVISAKILTSGLNVKQTGSALDYAKALIALTNAIPDVWTTYYTGSGKKSAQTRLEKFLSKGSQGGPPEFWSLISSLLSALPQSILTGPTEQSHNVNPSNEVRSQTSVLGALREGISRRDEPRASQGQAWNTYITAYELIQASIPDTDVRQKMCKKYLLPILGQYVRPSSEQASWTIAGAQAKSQCSRVSHCALREHPLVFHEEWHALSIKIIEDLKISAPEQSREYAKSQDSIAAETTRWYQLQASLLERGSSQDLTSVLTQSVSSEIDSALTIIKSRNGKPYGAATGIKQALQAVPNIILNHSTTKEKLLDFAANSIPDLIISPSGKYLINILDLLADEDYISSAYERSLENLADMPASEAKSVALQSFISSSRLAGNQSLSRMVMRELHNSLDRNHESESNTVIAAVANPAAPRPLTEEVLADLMQNLSMGQTISGSLYGLEVLTKQRENIIKDFALSAKGSSLLPNLLSLSGSNDENTAEKATGLSQLVKQAMTTQGDSTQAKLSMLQMIKRGLDTADGKSLALDTLTEQAQRLFQQSSPEELSEIAKDLLPTEDQWAIALQPFMKLAPNPSLAITNSLGGALSFVSAEAPVVTQQSIPRDQDGFSSAFRLAQYTTNMINTSRVFNHIDESHKVALCTNFSLFLQYAGDNLSIPGSQPLWISDTADQEDEIVEQVTVIQKVLASWISLDISNSAFIDTAQDRLLGHAGSLSTASYYSGRAYSALTIERKEIHGERSHQNSADRLKAIRKSEVVFGSAAYLVSASESKELRRLCNELIADLTDQEFEANTNEALRKLVLLSCIFIASEEYVADTPQQRLVFFVKNAVQQIEIIQPTSVVGGQTISILTAVLPAIKGIYGEFWATILDQVTGAKLRFSGDESLFGIHSTLKLVSLLRRPSMQKANDDLMDAWNERKNTVGEALIALLPQLADKSDEFHQPQRTINELLGRQITASSNDIKIETSGLAPILPSESPALQQATYQLLHAHIPSIQEQISVDKALSAEYVAHLPQELLSLLLSAPSMETLANSNFERRMPSILRSYLLSWKLIFDHWTNAGYKVQGDYVAALQEGTYVQDFLSFSLNILINSRTKPIDASKFDIENYTPELEESPEKETHWLLIHLYYLCLRHLPSITKAWWRDTASRQLNLSVLTWTEKYISPLLIASELSTMSSWAPSQTTADQPMTIKVSPTAREITASIPVDEQTMSISISLPKSYPLARAEVSSVHRVAVAEKKWNFWLINTQGVINFSSGGAGEGNAIIDGLMAWRKNVTAAMKGQAECAICYSVVSADRQLPSKKCQTCKNTFHSSCLFRWFKSSNSSSCPLCRNAFHYS